MRRTHNAVYLILVIMLLLALSFQVSFNGTSKKTLLSGSDALSTEDYENTIDKKGIPLVDANKNKLADYLETEIEKNTTQTMRILVQYRNRNDFSSKSSDAFTYELESMFPNVKVEYTYNLINAAVVIAPAQVVPKIAKLSCITRVEPDLQVQIALDTAVPVINADKVWFDYGYHGENQTIAILDTGIWPEHPDFEGKIVGWADFVNMKPDPYDDNGHGTMVASIAAGTGAGSNETYRGVAYMANIVAVKVLDSYGRGYVSSIIMGLEWIVTNKDVYNITVANLSFGSIGPSDGKDVLSLTCNQVVDAGIVVVVAAGNFGPKPYTVGPPAAAEKVIAVGAVDRSMDIAGFSSRGPTLDDRFKPDICAVGVSIMAGSLPYLKYPEIEWKIYRAVSGTSAAAPMIAGAAALLKQAHPDWSPEKVKAALLTRTVQREGGVNNDYGYGIADVFEALKGPKPTLTIYTWKFIDGIPTFAEARAYGQRSPNPYILIEGSWFTPDSYITIKWDNATDLVADVYVDVNGTFAINVTIPRSDWGIHYISAWSADEFVAQNSYEILRPTLVFSTSPLFQTTVDFGRPGITIWAKGEYYDPNGRVTIKWDNTTVLAEDVPTDSEGIFKTAIVIPLDATTGVHFVNVWNDTEFATEKEIHILVATPVSGLITEDTTWTKYGSPYVLTGDVLVYENKSLTIEPGVEVIANGMYYIWLYKGATLNATGDESQPVVFTANLSSTQKWGGIRLHYNSQNARILLQNVHISYARYGFMAYPDPWQAIDFTGLNVTIRNCKLTHCTSVTYIWGLWSGEFYVELSDTLVDSYEGNGFKVEYFWQGTIKIINNTFTSGVGDAIAIIYNGNYYEISGNTIVSNYGSGIYVDSPGRFGIIKDNLIMYNSEAGIKLRCAGGDIWNNYISKNRLGVKFTELSEGLTCNMFHNDIHTNAEYDVVSAQAGSATLNATYNYWGVTSQQAIEDRIYHFYDDFALAEVHYKPFLNASTRAYIFGYLIDFSTGQPIENATIAALGPTRIQTLSNASGYFALEGLIPGEYMITISKRGYDTISWFECVGAAQAFESNINMKRLLGGEATTVFDVSWEGTTWHVEVTSNSTVTDFNFSQPDMQISFKVSGAEGTTGFCNVTIPNALLGGPYTVLVDDSPVPFTPTSNNTHSFIYFAYNHSEHTVKIVGTTVIPEFECCVLLLFMAATLLMAALYKRRSFY
jgi:hypothetical protein